MLSPSLRRVRIAAAALAVGLCANAARAESGDIFAKWLNGADGFTQAMDKRRGTSDALLLYFYTDWCPYCRRFNTGILASKEVDEYLDHVIAVRINPEHGQREQAIAKTYGLAGYPTLLVLPAGADRPSEITTSGVSPSEFVQVCERAGAPHRAKKSAQTKPSPKTSLKTVPAPPQAASPSAPPAPARPAKNQVTLYLNNGETITGELVSETPEAVTLRWEYGDVVFQRAEIERLVKHD